MADRSACKSEPAKVIQAARTNQLRGLRRSPSNKDPADRSQQPDAVALGQPHMMIMWHILNHPQHDIEGINPRNRLRSSLGSREKRTRPRVASDDGGGNTANAVVFFGCHNFRSPEL